MAVRSTAIILHPVAGFAISTVLLAIIRSIPFAALLSLLTASASGQAPAVLQNRIFYEAGNTVTGQNYGASAYLLRSDGTYSELYRFERAAGTGNGEWFSTVDGTYEYFRTSELQAVLRIRPGGTASSTEHRLTFSSESHGRIEPPPGTGRLHGFWLGSQISPPLATAPLANVSLRAPVNAGGTTIGGFVIAGRNPRAVLVRAVGPGLAPFGVTSILLDPKLSVPKLAVPFDGNDDWSAGGAALSSSLRQVEALTGAFPLESGSKDAALILPELQPGAYTIHVESAVPAGAGEVLIEVYLLP